MHLLRRKHEFEYRDSAGQDQDGIVDIWVGKRGRLNIVVLRNIPIKDAQIALNTLSHILLPYLLNPEAELIVMALYPAEEGEKARAFVLPLSA